MLDLDVTLVVVVVLIVDNVFTNWFEGWPSDGADSPSTWEAQEAHLLPILIQYPDS